jgi:hypothetical protein
MCNVDVTFHNEEGKISAEVGVFMTIHVNSSCREHDGLKEGDLL